ncbi:MAG: hypothetical protein ACO1TE_27190 [Prosthecobacter sp.]
MTEPDGISSEVMEAYTRLKHDLQIGIDQLERGESVTDFDIEEFLSDMKAERSARQRALAALNGIAGPGGVAGIDDPLKWQRDQRTDRPLPGRES